MRDLLRRVNVGANGYQPDEAIIGNTAPAYEEDGNPAEMTCQLPAEA
jgi:hypothetical protein